MLLARGPPGDAARRGSCSPRRSRPSGSWAWTTGRTRQAATHPRGGARPSADRIPLRVRSALASRSASGVAGRGRRLSSAIRSDSSMSTASSLATNASRLVAPGVQADAGWQLARVGTTRQRSSCRSAGSAQARPRSCRGPRNHVAFGGIAQAPRPRRASPRAPRRPARSQASTHSADDDSLQPRSIAEPAQRRLPAPPGRRSSTACARWSAPQTAVGRRREHLGNLGAGEAEYVTQDQHRRAGGAGRRRRAATRRQLDALRAAHSAASGRPSSSVNARALVRVGSRSIPSRGPGAGAGVDRRSPARTRSAGRAWAAARSP